MAAGAQAPIGRIDLLFLPTRVDRAVASVARVVEPRPLRAFVGDWLAAGYRRDEQALLVGAGVRLTATAASSRINQLARELLARGAGLGSVVAVRIPRSVDSSGGNVGRGRRWCGVRVRRSEASGCATGGVARRQWRNIGRHHNRSRYTRGWGRQLDRPAGRVDRAAPGRSSDHCGRR